MEVSGAIVAVWRGGGRGWCSVQVIKCYEGPITRTQRQPTTHQRRRATPTKDVFRAHYKDAAS